jgi:hypothetical protein
VQQLPYTRKLHITQAWVLSTKEKKKQTHFLFLKAEKQPTQFIYLNSEKADPIHIFES